MSETTGDSDPAAGIKASDAERDATVQRLSTAAGDGRLTLEEFSQRMERATAARTRTELDSLVTDLPQDTQGTQGTVAAGQAAAAPASSAQASSGPASWHISPIGGLSVSGPWRMDRHVISISIIGGARLDLSQAQLAAPEVTLTKVSVLGGVWVEVPQGVRVQVSGVSLIGGTSIDGGPEPGPGAPIVHIRAFSILGGVRISRSAPSQQPAQDRLDRWDRRGRRRHRRNGRIARI